MTLDPIAVLAALLSLAALGRTFARPTGEPLVNQTKKRDIGNRTAVFAWTYARAVTPKDRPELLERCAVQTFELIDITVDGKRDFTRDEAREFIAQNKEARHGG